MRLLFMPVFMFVYLADPSTTSAVNVCVKTQDHHHEHCKEVPLLPDADWATFVILVKVRIGVQCALDILDGEGYVIQDLDAIEPGEKVFANMRTRRLEQGVHEDNESTQSVSSSGQQHNAPIQLTSDASVPTHEHHQPDTQRRRRSRAAPPKPTLEKSVQGAKRVSYAMDKAYGPHALMLDELRKNMTAQREPTVYNPFQMPIAKVHIGDVLSDGREWQGLNDEIKALVHGHYDNFTTINRWLANVNAETKNDAFYRLHMSAETATSDANWKTMYASSSSFLKLVAVIQHVADSFLSHLKLDAVKQGRKRAVSAAWASIHHDGSQHSSHVHPNNLLAAVYYCGVPEGSTSLVFEASHMGSGMEEFAVQMREGSIVVFPGWVPHRVRRVGSTAKRCSLSFNLPGDWESINQLHGAAAFSIGRMAGGPAGASVHGDL